MKNVVHERDTFERIVLQPFNQRGWILAFAYPLAFAFTMWIFHLIAAQEFIFDGAPKGILEDLGNVFNHLVLVPVGFLLIHRFTRSTTALMECPPDRSFINFSALEGGIFGLVSGKKIIIISLFLGLAITLTSNSQVAPEWQRGEYSFFGQWSLPALAFKVFTTLNYTMIVAFFARGFALIIRVYSLKMSDLVFQPFHEDEMAGAGLLSRSLLDLSSFVTLIALFLINQALFSNALNDGGIFKFLFSVFVLIYLAVVILPLRRLKTLFDQWKQLQHDKLRSHYGALYDSDDGSEFVLRIARNSEAVSQLVEAKSVIKQVPSWPLRLSPFVLFIALNLLAPAVFEYVSGLAMSVMGLAP